LTKITGDHLVLVG